MLQHVIESEEIQTDEDDDNGGVNVPDTHVMRDSKHSCLPQLLSFLNKCVT